MSETIPSPEPGKLAPPAPKTFSPTKTEKSAFDGISVRNNLLQAEVMEILVEAAARLAVDPKGLSYNFNNGTYVFQEPVPPLTA